MPSVYISPMAATKKLFLLDAYALIYRAHFAFTKTPRINSKGINTSVPFGFTNTMLEVLLKQKPTHIGVAFDTSAKTFRDEMFAEYKANRQETPEDIRYGTPKVKEIIRGFNIPVLELDGYEADDVIGTLAKQAEKAGFEVFMMTPDKDYGQLVTENIHLYKPAYMGNAVDIMGPKEVCEKWDIENVLQVIDILGLQGDASDNIPGIPGVGPKTAAELIKKFGTVENVIANAHQLKGKQKERVEEFGEQAILSKQLATISLDVPIAFDEDALIYRGPDEAKLKPILEELEFKTMMPRIFGGATVATTSPATQTKAAQLSMFGGGAEVATEDAVQTDIKTFSEKEVTYTLADTPAIRKQLIEKLKLQKEFSVEAVTDNHQVNGLAFAWVPGEAMLVPIGARETLQEFASVLTDDKIGKVGHNLKAIMLALKEYGMEVNGNLFDTTVAHYLIEPEASHDLKNLCLQYTGYELMDDGAHSQLYQMCERADLVLQLKHKLVKDLEKKRHTKLMNDVEMPLMKVLAAMEFEGVRIDEKALAKMSEELKKESAKVQQEIYKIAGTEFNIGSPKQLGEILFDKLKLAEGQGGKTKKTKTGQYATGEEILLKLAGDNPIAKKILDYREYEKLRSTYVDALPRLISKRDGRVHTDYRQAVAATGRLSSNNPNLQNIPIRTAKGREIRKAFVARGKDYLFMSADYSQIELRIAASFAHDEIMIDAFKNKRDIHTTTAAKVFKVALDKVTPDMRRKAKEVNFGILYGSTAFGLSQNLGISRTEATEIINSYFTEFAAIKRYMDNSILHARETEFVETILGRRRYLRDINSRNVTTRGFAERNAINAPIQGSAADIIKIAMVNIQRWMLKEKLQSKMIMQVHDELVFDVHKAEVEHVKENIRKLMQHAVALEVPMEVEVGVGANWLEAH
jgi:DNA polymerase I